MGAVGVKVGGGGGVAGVWGSKVGGQTAGKHL